MIIEQDAATTNRAPTNAWNLYVGPEICQNLREGLDHEWLVTNGLGGYGAGAINGATTRSYHGLLVAALQPPVDRTVLVTKIDEEVTLLDGQPSNWASTSIKMALSTRRETSISNESVSKATFPISSTASLKHSRLRSVSGWNTGRILPMYSTSYKVRWTRRVKKILSM